MIQKQETETRDCLCLNNNINLSIKHLLHNSCSLAFISETCGRPDPARGPKFGDEPSQLTANKLTTNQRFCYSDFITNFVAVISSQSEGLGKMALGIVKIYLGSPFSANRHCPRSVCLRSVGSRSVCRGQLSWTRLVTSALEAK